MENKLIELQEILFKNINSLDKETENVATEIARNNTLSNSEIGRASCRERV